MEILILSLLASLSYLIIVVKVFGMARVVRWGKWLDIAFTVGVPVITATTGTFSALTLSILSGLFFTMFHTALRALWSVKSYI